MTKARRKPGRGIDQHGRSKRDAKHVRIYEWEIKSPAWRSLCPHARALLIEFRRRYDGQNNGDIVMSVRSAMRALGAGYGATTRALTELQDRGFVKMTRKGRFTVREGVRDGTTWALNSEPLGNKGATKEFMSWTPSAPPEKQGAVTDPVTVPSQCSDARHSKTPKKIPNRYDNGDAQRPNPSIERHRLGDTYILPGGRRQPDAAARGSRNPAEPETRLEIGSGRKSGLIPPVS